MKQLLAMIPETEEEKRNHNLTHNFVTEDGRLTDSGNALVGLAIECLNKACFQNSKAHGWYEDYMADPYHSFNPTGDNVSQELRQRNFGEVMALITSEVSEAFEAFRDGDDQTRISYLHKDSGELCLDPECSGKPEGIAAELADVLIRVFDYAGAYGVPLGEAIIRKHNYNFTRPYRHGGKLA